MEIVMSNNGQRFADLDADSRKASIERSRIHVELEQSKLAGKLIAHAAALIKSEFPTAFVVAFYLTPGYGDAASVQIAHVYADKAANDLELDIAPDFQSAPETIGMAEVLLAEASDLGAHFQLAGIAAGQRHLNVHDPLDGVRLPVEV
jgi:hypothetical protein